MGIRGLTTFIANRSDRYFVAHELHNTTVVIDGNSLACNLYTSCRQCNDCFGGDYDKYSRIIQRFFENLLQCNITPLIVMDGGYEKRKMKTVLNRMKQRIATSCRLNSVTEKSSTLFPLFFCHVFIDVALKMGLKIAQTDFEADSEIACLARALNCPVLSFDSDFYIFDVLYIPIPSLDYRKVQTRNNVKFLTCSLYKVDLFLDSFGGLDKANLPLLAALLGNDYITKSAFNSFYQNIKVAKIGGGNEQQNNIAAIIAWLRHETPESALCKILSRYKLAARKRIAASIQEAIRGYQANSTILFDYFQIPKPKHQIAVIKVPNPEKVHTDPDAADSYVEDEEEELEEDLGVEVNSVSLPAVFLDNFRKCVYPPCFMNLIYQRTCYFFAAVDDYQQEHGHKISLTILAAIYEMLTKPDVKPMKYITRHQETIKGFYLEPQTFPVDLPNVYQMAHTTVLRKHGKKLFLSILQLNNVDLSDFPPEWHLYIIGIKYLIANAESSVTVEAIYSLMLCLLILKYVDPRIGYIRTEKSLNAKHPRLREKMSTNSGIVNKETGRFEWQKEIDFGNAVNTMHACVSYFEMEQKMRNRVNLYDRKIVHMFAELQSCLMQIRHLNALLDFPFPQLQMALLFDGTFLYNMTVNLLKRNVGEYLKSFLGKCPVVLDMLELLVAKFDQNSLSKTKKKRKRKKKKKTSNGREDSSEEVMSDWENMVDPNNIYSVLSLDQ